MNVTDLGQRDVPTFGRFEIEIGLTTKKMATGIVGNRWAIEGGRAVATLLATGRRSPEFAIQTDADAIVVLLALDACEPWDGSLPCPDDVAAVFKRWMAPK